MTVFEELKARGLIAQVTDEEEIRNLINNGIVSFQQANFTRSGQGVDVRGGKAHVYTSYFAQRMGRAATGDDGYAKLGEQGKSIELTNNYYVSGFRFSKAGTGLIYGSDKK